MTRAEKAQLDRIEQQNARMEALLKCLVRQSARKTDDSQQHLLTVLYQHYECGEFKNQEVAESAGIYQVIEQALLNAGCDLSDEKQTTAIGYCFRGLVNGIITVDSVNYQFKSCGKSTWGFVPLLNYETARDLPTSTNDTEADKPKPQYFVTAGR